MIRHTKAILGIPIDNVTSQEAVDRVVELVEKCKQEKVAGYISTVNSDFLSKVHGVAFTTVNQPELLKVLRKSVLATADGAPLIWLSYLLGDPLKERVAGADLFESIAKRFAEKQLSIYLLGGEEKVVKTSVEQLTSRYPGLRIAGYATPQICTEGGGLIHSEEKDRKIIQEINKCAPDLLFLNLGNPKQEIWFERIRRHLKAPLSMGIGGTLDLFSKTIPRAPEWMQNIGMEWLYRLMQEPGRLWRRYIYDAFKFTSLAIPLVFYHQISRLAYKLRRPAGKNQVARPLLFISPERTLSVIQLPPLLDQEACVEIASYAEDVFCQDVVILDFEKVLHMDLEGISLLTSIWEEARKLKKNIYALHVSEDIVLLMKVHRIWDLLYTTIAPSPQEILSDLLKEKTGFALYDSMQQHKREIVISLFGQLDGELDSEKFVERFSAVIDGKNCLLSLRYCTFINNSGFVCLLRLNDYLREQGCTFKISGVSPEIENLFRVNKILSAFSIVKS